VGIKTFEILREDLKNIFNFIAIVVLTASCTSMDSDVPFPNNELQECIDAEERGKLSSREMKLYKIFL